MAPTSGRRSSDRTESVEGNTGPSLRSADISYTQRSGNPHSMAVHFAIVVLADVATFLHLRWFCFSLRPRRAIPLPLAPFCEWLGKNSLSNGALLVGACRILKNRCVLVRSFAIRLRSVWPHVCPERNWERHFPCKQFGLANSHLQWRKSRSMSLACSWLWNVEVCLAVCLHAMQNPSQNWHDLIKPFCAVMAFRNGELIFGSSCTAHVAVCWSLLVGGLQSLYLVMLRARGARHLNNLQSVSIENFMSGILLLIP